MATTPPPPTPSLSKAEQRECNRMADHMNAFHEHFRHQWNAIYAAVCAPSANPTSTTTDPSTPTPRYPLPASRTPLPPSKLLRAIEDFSAGLHTHHAIEEQYIFPVLAARMPEFGAAGAQGPVGDHKLIHAGLDALDAYARRVRGGETELARDEVRRIMEGFGDTLWRHLEEEVELLGWRNLTRFWTREEIGRMPM